MGSEASARPISFSLIILCLIFTLLGSEFKYQSIAQTFPTLPDEEGKMGSEASARPISFSLIILCLIFTLCQLGSEFKYQSIAQTFPTLPDEEVIAMTVIAWKLGLDTPMDFERSSCNENIYLQSIFGITCDCTFQSGKTCHITEIELRAKRLTGFIPEELASLTYLKKLDLSMNQLTGSIPPSLGNLSSLNILNLHTNQLTGPIPESLGNMKFAVFKYSRTSSQHNIVVVFELVLASNQLNGSIPATLGNVAVSPKTSDPDTYQRFKRNQYDSDNVESQFKLDLSNNQLTGAIPESLGNLTFANYFCLNGNFLTGSIPARLGALTYLEQLYLFGNGFSGTLPQTLGNLTNIKLFWVGSNNINGTLPQSFARLTRLTNFSVEGNYLSGPVPDFIANKWTSIKALLLNGNNFNGTIPAEIFNLSHLEYLAISDVAESHFQFPASTNVPRNLSILILRNCSITGQIPSYIGDMSKLQILDLSFNNLTGRIPDSLKNINLSLMSFSNNMLSGKIPDWIQNAVWSKMDLSNNSFSKPTFEPSPKLELNLFSCCCNSSTCLPNTTDPTREKYCPRGKPNYHSLFINCGGGRTLVDGNVYDQDNDTSQYHLSQEGNWARTSAGNTIYLEYNSDSSRFLKRVKCGLSSEAALYDRARTSPVSLKYYGFCLRKGKYNVTLHFAEIDDEANDYRSPHKRVFDVYIQGERKLTDFNIMDKARQPNTKHIENFGAVDVNDSTLEIQFYWAGKGTPDEGPLISAISVTPEYKLHKQLPPSNIALITVASIIGFVLLLLLFAWMMGWLGTDHLQEIDIRLEKPVTLKQLKDATRNFSKRNEIGQGGFGTVYKAEVQGKIVAVKKLSSHSEERINQLKNEFYTLKSMSQENLVQLLDIYNAKGLHLLIYEYMQNKSLAHALFDSKSKLKLDWKSRYNICLGIARGLVYLHEHPRLKMVHRDIKSANILLDGNLKAKISDFGLASLYTEDDQFKFIKVEVPQGYMAPEYVRGIVTSKADVYSFGVVILETVSGRTNAGHRRDSQESEFLLDTAYDLQQKGRLVDLVDKTLSTKYDAKQAIIILNLAVKCTSISPTLRPTMSEVVSVLVGDKKIEEICPPALYDSHIAQVDSSVSMEVTSTASTSSNLIKREDETEHISETTP